VKKTTGKLSWEAPWIKFQHDTVHFVTCAPIQQKRFLSILGYISAFDLATWIVILSSVVLSVLSWNYVLAKTKKSSFSAVFFLKILLGQSTNEIQYIRLITGAWVLAGLFLTNKYQGNNIDQLTSPFASKRFENFGEILANNLTIYSLPMGYETLKVIIPSWDPKNKTDDYYKYFSFHFKPNEVTFGKMFLNRKSRNATNELFKRAVKFPANYSEMINMLRLKYSVDAISKCKQDVFATVEGEKQITSPFKPISIESNVVERFYTDLAFKLACLCIFLCECIKYINIYFSSGRVFSELRMLCVRCFVGLKAIIEGCKLSKRFVVLL